MTKQKILFVTYGGGHVNMIIPLIKALRKDQPRIEPLVLALTTAKSALDAVNIDAFTMHDFLGRDNKEAMAWGEKLAEQLEGNKLPYTETVAYLGLNYKELVDEHGEEKAAELYAEKGRHAFLPEKLMRRILSTVNPAVVVTTNSPRTERATIMAAKALDIPSVCMIDLFANQGSWIWENGFADKVCVFNQDVKDSLIQKGRQDQEIVVTGNPAFDNLYSNQIDLAAERMRNKKNWGDKKVLLWASQVEPAQHPFTGQPGNVGLPSMITEHLISVFKDKPDWQLIIRPHPSEMKSYIDLPDHVDLSTARDSIDSLLHAVDAVTTTASTVGLQAALINKPVYQIHGSIFYQDLPLDQMGYATAVPDIMAFEHILLGESDNTQKRVACERATPKVINVIMEALQIHQLKFYTQAKPIEI